MARLTSELYIRRVMRKFASSATECGSSPVGPVVVALISVPPATGVAWWLPRRAPAPPRSPAAAAESRRLASARPAAPVVPATNRSSIHLHVSVSP